MERMRARPIIASLSTLFAAGTATLLIAAKPVEKKGTALLFLSTDCPVAQRLSPTIKNLITEYTPKGIEFKAYFPNDLETRDGIQRFMSERGIAAPWQLDFGAQIAKSEGVKGVPTLLVLDANGKNVYRGAILDNKDPSLPHRNYAEEALDAVLAGKTPKVKETEVIGCVLMPGQAPPAPSKVTYAEHVAPILNKRCVGCHRPGEVAPFSMIGYDNAKKWAPMIAQRTDQRKMPPWKAIPGFGEFKDENLLSEVEIETLKRWSAAGAPRGDAKKEPPTPTFGSEWPLGQPDLILQAAKPYRVEADGPDDYRQFILKTSFKDTKYVTAMSVKPGNPKVVHHVIAFLDEKGASWKLEGREKDGKEGYSTFGGVGFPPDGSYGGWAPGLRPQKTPDGVAFELKPGATIVMQVHYHKNGKVEMDQTRLGLYFADKEPEKIMSLAWLANPFFRIPAGAKAHKVASEFPIPADVTVYSLMPHMHMLGRTMKAEVLLPDGSTKPLIRVDDWDFNWQLNYMLKEPLKIPAGSKVRVEAVYDNSESNPTNPSKPPRVVTWGEQTTDEMFLLVASYTLDHARAPKTKRVGFGGG